MRKRILLVVLCFCMVLGVCGCGKTDEPVEKANTATKTTETGEEKTIKYMAGVYTSTLTLYNEACILEVEVDENEIKSISISPLDDSTTGKFYPLIQSVLDDLSKQICQSQSMENLTYSDDELYTERILIECINMTLEKAKVTPDVSQMTIEELKLTRERTRSEMKEPLLMLIDSPNVTNEEKQKAVAQLNDIACISEKEREAELLLEAKGFENIVEIFDGEKCNVTLVCDNMSDIERQQIADIVKEKTEISADKIVITAISN